ncbi:MAG: NAD(P)/FAD-dependent oxidoreductase [Opitutales bacterium]|nr:NAD(P)/FAD-dependent oxidoreductase [Opitutales bacterium]
MVSHKSEQALPEKFGSEDSFDVIVIGGALSGASAAYLLKREHPDKRILIIERSEQFSRRVGEATVEISSYFLTRVLGLTEYLNHEHLSKQGLRFWFYQQSDDAADGISELGPGYNVRFPSYQVDRAKLDEEVLRRAEASGVTVYRPAVVKSVDWTPGGQSTVEFEQDSQRRVASARWVIDASGVARLMARSRKWVIANDAHPIASIWSRWRGIDCIDGLEFRAEHPNIAGRCVGTRFTATNHLIGYGWWSWWIPLQGRDMSVGIVWDERFTQVAAGDSLADRLRNHLEQHPLGKRLLAGAEMVEDDLHYRKHLAWHSERMAGDGLCLVGDAAAFMDPFYSPGMDWISFGVSASVRLIRRDWEGEAGIAEHAEQLNRDLKESYLRWFEAIYRDKYRYMGDFDLMKLAFRLDLGLYYYGVVSQPYKHGEQGLLQPPFTGPHTEIPYRIIRFYNRRLARIAEARRRRGVWGKNNFGQNFSFNSYRMDWTLPIRLLGAGASYLKLELTEGWRSWFRSPEAVPDPQVVAASAKAKLPVGSG